MANLNQINELIEQLGAAERVTKAALLTLSRDVLEYIVINDGIEGNNKGSEDSQVVNRLLATLTPINRKVAEHFFKHFLAFRWNDETLSFGGKDKKQWDKKHALVVEFLADPHQNIWSWADRNVDVAPKPMDFAKLNAAMGQLIKKADKANLGHDNIVRAMLANGITLDELMTVIHVVGKDDPIVEEQPAPAVAVVAEQQAA